MVVTKRPTLGKMNIWIVLACLLAYCFGSILYLPHTMDDAYITFRFAKNLVEHGVWVWDIHQQGSQAYTSTLYAILAIIPNYFSLNAIPFFKTIGIMSVAVIILNVIYRNNKGIAPLAVLVILCTNVPLYYHQTSCMETMLFASLLFGLIIFMHQKNVASTVFCTVLLALTRPEGAVFGLIAIYLLRNELWQDKHLILLLLLTGACYVGFHWIQFGTIIPNALIRKTVTNYALTHFVSNLFKARFYLIAIGVMYFVLKDYKIKAMIPGAVFVFIIIYAPSDLMMNIHDRFFWQIFFPILLSGLLLMEEPVLSKRYLIVLLTCIFLNISTWDVDKVVKETSYPQQMDQYHALADVLNKSQPGTILLCDAGIIPYYSEWNAIDFIGLTDPKIARTGLNPKDLSAFKTEVILLYADGLEIDSYWKGFFEQDDIYEYIRAQGTYARVGQIRFDQHNILIFTDQSYLDKNPNFSTQVKAAFNSYPDQRLVGLSNPYHTSYLFR